tara:strand:- start:296 stop:721 length:426 start_codon:yes stop_codon:yes gene_type:complete
MIDVKFPIKVKDLAKVVDQANINPSTMNDNKLIAEFMGYELEGEFWVATMSKEDDTFLGRHLLFHTSWDWLMPVVEAINDYVNDEGEPIYSVEIDPNHVTIRRGLHTAIVVDRPQVNSYMEMIYLAVVEFAKRFHQYGQSL